MPAYSAAIIRRLAPSCISSLSSSQSFCRSFASAWRTGSYPLASSRFSLLGSPIMYQFMAPPSEPWLNTIQSVFHSLQKGLSSMSARPPKPLRFYSSNIDAGFFVHRNVPSENYCFCAEGAFSSSAGLPSSPQQPKLLSAFVNCHVDTNNASEALATVETVTEKVAHEKVSHNQAEVFSVEDTDKVSEGLKKGKIEAGPLGELIHTEYCCEDAASSVSLLLSNDVDAKLEGGRFNRKLGMDSLSNRVKSRPERRRKGTVFARSVQNELPDLLTVPGIGPRNFEKLVAKGIGKVAELKQLYRDKFLTDESQKMVEFLQTSVGIVHKHHAESITSYVKQSVDEELKEQMNSVGENNIRQKKVTICVEGNISVGKTTFLQKISNGIIELRDLVEIVPEPVDKWKDVGPDHFNLLDAFYNEPERYAYTFQNYVFATRLMKEQETSKGMKPLRLMERSIFSDRLVFVRAVHEAKWMSELELRIYESWFDPFIAALPGLVPDGFIYLRASPDTCLQRLHMRNRPEERSVTLEYLRGLHEKHEQCFLPSETKGDIISVSRWPLGPHEVPPPPNIRDRVVYLEGDHLHSSMRKVPALILDCEASIDLNKDLEARAEYAQQVAEFYEYIRSNKDLDMKEKVSCGTVNPFLLPYPGGLVRPDGSPLLHGHPLDAFNFARPSSTVVT